MFDKKGMITVATSSIGEDELMELVLGAGAEDVQNAGEVYEITCDPAAYEGLKKAIEEKNIPIQSAEISMVPQTMIAISTAETARKILRLMEASTTTTTCRTSTRTSISPRRSLPRFRRKSARHGVLLLSAERDPAASAF